MHLECGRIYQVTWAHKILVQVMLSQNVTHILAKKAFDTFSKLLNAIDVALCHTPRSVWRIGFARLEFFDLQLGPVIHRNICNQIANHWKSAHRLEGD